MSTKEPRAMCRSKRAQRRPGRRPESGFTLIEVLISLLVFSFGVLGMVGLQATASKLSVDSEERTRAALLASEMVATMWGNQSTTVSDGALTAWNTRLADTSAMGLPGGSGTVGAADANGVVTVTVTWTSPARAGKTSQFLTQFVIPQ